MDGSRLFSGFSQTTLWKQTSSRSAINKHDVHHLRTDGYGSGTKGKVRPLFGILHSEILKHLGQLHEFKFERQYFLDCQIQHECYFQADESDYTAQKEIFTFHLSVGSTNYCLQFALSCDDPKGNMESIDREHLVH